MRPSALGQDLGLGGLEDPDELAADDLALLLRVDDAVERLEELLLGVHDLELDAGGGHEVALDLLGLALAHQPVVDVHAGQPVADRALHDRGRDRRVDAAGEPADRLAAVADLGADRLDLLLDDVDHRPGRPAAGDLVQEVLEHLLAVLGVQHLGVPLHPGQPAVDVLERRDRRRRGRREHPEAVRCRGHRVAVGHPDVVRGRYVGEQRARSRDRDRGAAVLARAGVGDLAAEAAGHQLEAVAHAEDRYAGGEEALVDGRCALGVHRRRPAGEHDRLRVAGQHLGDRHGVRHDLGVDPGLADPAGDQLGVLRPEVDHQDQVVLARSGEPSWVELIADARASQAQPEGPRSSLRARPGRSAAQSSRVPRRGPTRSLVTRARRGRTGQLQSRQSAGSDRLAAPSGPYTPDRTVRPPSRSTSPSRPGRRCLTCRSRTGCSRTCRRW